LPEEEYWVEDLELDLPPGLFSAPTGTQGFVVEKGVQGVQGVLVDPESGSPVRSAEVSLRDGAGRTVASGLANQRGFFRIEAPIPGPYLFSSKALGYGEVHDQVVEITRGRLTVLEVQMAPEALALEPLVVIAESRAFRLEMEGFYEREEQGLHNGIFMTPEFLEKRQPRRVSDLFFALPGTRVMEPALGAGSRAVYFRGGERIDSICWPMVYVDRHLVSPGGLGAGAEPTALDDVVHGLDESAIEVYRYAAEIPPEFNGPNAGCGVVVVWTRRGRGG